MVSNARNISKSRFKARALELFRDVEETGQPVVVTDRGQPVIEVRRYQPPRPLDQLRGTVLHYDRPFDPVAEQDWESAG
jgi:hypothetical protein